MSRQSHAYALLSHLYRSLLVRQSSRGRIGALRPAPAGVDMLENRMLLASDPGGTLATAMVLGTHAGQTDLSQPLATFDDSISPGNDLDLFRFNAHAGDSVRFNVTAPGGIAIKLLDAAGLMLTGDYTILPSAYVTRNITTTGTYYIGLSAYDNTNYWPTDGGNSVVGHTTTYSLSVNWSTAAVLGAQDLGTDTSNAWPLALNVGTPVDYFTADIRSGTPDFYRINVNPADEGFYTIAVRGTGGFDPHVRLFDAAGVEKTSATNPFSATEPYYLTAGTYYVGVSAADNGGGQYSIWVQQGSDTLPVIPDANLRQAIMDQLARDRHAPFSVLTNYDMERLTSLNAANRGITDLTGLEYATNLRSLNLTSNPIGDAGLARIAMLKSLTDLTVSDCGITSLAALAPSNPLDPRTGMPNLANLVLDMNPSLTDYGAIRTMAYLRYLDIGSCGLSDTSPLNGLTNLTGLSIGGNFITSLGDIATLTGLQNLSLENDAQVTDLSGLAGLTSLQTLVLNGVPIGQAQAGGIDWSAFPSMWYLALSQTGLTDISFLTLPSGNAAMPGLLYLLVENNSLTSLNGVGSYGQLPYLFGGGNSISDISAVAGCGSLRYLALDNNQVSDLSPLTGLTNLESFTLSYNHIMSLAGADWSSLTNLQSVYLSHNGLHTDPASADGQTIQGLIDRGVYVDVSNQDYVPAFQIADANLEQAIRNQFTNDGHGIDPAAALTEADMLALTDLEAYGAGITDLTGLEYATNLQILNLNGYNNTFGDTGLAIIGQLTSLQKLYVNDTGITTLAPIAGLTNLTDLDIGNNLIADADALRGFTNLTYLCAEASGPAIGSDPSVVSGLTELKTLWLDYVGLSSVSSLSSLTQLEQLVLGGSDLHDLSPLDGLPALVSLSITSAHLTDADVATLDFSSLPSLTTLNFSGNAITSLEFVRNIPGLTTISAESNQISDLTPLASCGSLYWVHLNRNNISDISLLSGQPNLAYLSVSENHITSLAGLHDLPALQNLLVAHNELTTMAGDWSTLYTDTTWRNWNLDVSFNHLDTTPGAPDRTVIDDLIARGINVVFDNQQAKQISDANLESAIRNQLASDGNGIDPAAPLTAADLLNLTTLNASYYGISSLEGLEDATNLQSLNLCGNPISDITPILGLSSLTSLNLSYTSLTDAGIAGLGSLTNLQTLAVGGLGITDLSPIAGLNLTELNIGDCPNITDLSPIAGMTGMINLYANGTGISSIAPLDRMTSLQRLYIGNTFVTDLSPVVSLTHLYTFSLPYTIPDTLAPVSVLPNLGELMLQGCQISDVDLADVAWSGMNLDYLDLRQNQLTDLSALAGSHVSRLYVGTNDLGSLSSLSGLTSLTVLDIQYNHVSDLWPISGLTNLYALYADGNQITSIDALASLTSMQYLFLQLNQITDLSPVNSMTLLYSLYANNNELTSLAGVDFAALPSLQYGNFAFNHLATWPEGADAPILADLQVRSPYGFALPSPQNVVFADANFESAIRNALAIPSAAITSINMETLTSIDLHDIPLTSIAGIEYATNLTSVDLRGTGLDFSPGSPERERLALLIARGVTVTIDMVHIGDANLEAAIRDQLAADGHGIAAAMPLMAADLRNLTTLNATNRGITDLSGLNAATNLWRLDLNGNSGLSDLSPLSGMTTLNTVHFDGTAVTDLSTLATLPNLYDLSLNNTHPASLDAIFSPALTQLRFLGLQNCQLGDAMFASQNWASLHLWGLDISFNQLSSLSPISGMTTLGDLSIANNAIVSLAPLSSLSLVNLEARSNQIADLSPLSRMSSLRALYVFYNLITDISPLASLTGMQRLYIGGNAITDLSPIQGMSDLTVLYAQSMQLHSISNVNFALLPQLYWGGLGDNYLNIWPESPDGQTVRMLWNRAGGAGGFGYWDQHVTFADPNFELAIRTALNRPATTFPSIYETNMNNAALLSTLDLSGQNLISLQGIENALSLTFLDLRRTGLNLSPGTPDRARVDLLLSRGVTVLFNAAPVVSFGGDATLNEGGTYTGGGSFIDTDADTWTATVDYGDGTGVQSLTLNPDHSFLLSHRYDDNGTYGLTVSVSDGTDTDSLSDSVTVSSVAPTGTVGLVGAAVEGSPATFRFTGQADPSHADVAAGFIYSYSLDGGAFVAGAATYVLSGDRIPNGPSIHTLRGRIVDKDGASSEYSLLFKVQNAIPSLTIPAAAPISVGGTYAATGSFADSGLDTWTAKVNYGDGSGLQALALAGKTFALSHVYARTGVFPMTVWVTDSDGASGTATRLVTVNQLPPQVTGITVNDGTSAQRSMVTSITCTFSSVVTLDAGAISLIRSDGQAVTLSYTAGPAASFRLTFTSGPLEGVSLADGRYTFSVIGSKVHLGATTMAGTATSSITRLFGDSDGDGDVDGLDVKVFTLAYTKSKSDPAYQWYFDLDSNNVVDAIDYKAFRLRLNKSV